MTVLDVVRHSHDSFGVGVVRHSHDSFGVTVGDLLTCLKWALIQVHIDVCMLCSTGGSLDNYGTIPEEVLGRIAVAVSVQLAWLPGPCPDCSCRDHFCAILYCKQH